MKPNAFSRHSSPRNREAPAWDCPLVGGSSRLMAAICGRAPTQDGVRPFSSRCPSRRCHNRTFAESEIHSDCSAKFPPLITSLDNVLASDPKTVATSDGLRVSTEEIHEVFHKY